MTTSWPGSSRKTSEYGNFPQDDPTQLALDNRERLRIPSRRRQCGLEHSDEFETQTRRARLVPVTGFDRLGPRLGPEYDAHQ
jgi:hypothetical protein